MVGELPVPSNRPELTDWWSARRTLQNSTQAGSEDPFKCAGRAPKVAPRSRAVREIAQGAKERCASRTADHGTRRRYAAASLPAAFVNSLARGATPRRLTIPKTTKVARHDCDPFKFRTRSSNTPPSVFDSLDRPRPCLEPSRLCQRHTQRLTRKPGATESHEVIACTPRTPPRPSIPPLCYSVPGTSFGEQKWTA